MSPEGKRVLTLNIAADESARLDAVLFASGLPPAEPIAAGQTGLTVRELLCGRAPGAPDVPPASLGERLVFFAGADMDAVRAVLAGVRESGLTPPIYAMATPTNIDWPLPDLLEHLIAERAAVTARSKAARAAGTRGA